jgi:hypothetical protein
MNQICLQRRRQMLFTIPPQRYTPDSPYVQFPNSTQKQLDMRRKAEILSYPATKTNTKTNNFTKKQKWTQLVSGNQQKNSYTTLIQRNRAPYSYIDICGNTQYNTFDQLFDIVKPAYDCSRNNDLLPTPTSSSGIPGPIEYLIRDVNVPLYNYATNRNINSILQSENSVFWNIYTVNDVSYSTAISKLYGTLVIRQPVDQYGYTFSIQTPISLFVGGTSTLPSKSTLTNMSLTLRSVSLQVYYNNQPVPFPTPPVFKWNGATLDTAQGGTATFSNNSAYLNYDISGNNSYFYQDYVGILSISNVYLFTEPGYIYDFYLTFWIDAPFLSNASYAIKYGTTTTFGLLCNTSTGLQKSIGVLNKSTNNKIAYANQSFFGRA